VPASSTAQPSADELTRRALDALSEDDRRDHVAYYDGTVRPAGSGVELGGVQLSGDDDYVVVYVDEMPGANYAHPGRYLVVTQNGVTSRPAEWPPKMGRLPSPWRVLYRPAELGDWQVLPLESERSS
jgi:hypothetical protein